MADPKTVAARLRVRVVEFWRREPQFQWARVPELEVKFPQEVAM
jgi:hypothetical protein